MRMVVYLFSSAVVFISVFAQAEHLLSSDYHTQRKTLSHGFYGPNEFNPELQRNSFSQLQGDVGLSVGTERGFIHASYSSINHLILFDIDPMATAYNKFNIALLRASKSREQFQRLKAWGKYREFYDLAKELPEEDPYKSFLQSYSVFEILDALRIHHSGYQALTNGKKTRRADNTNFGFNTTKTKQKYQFFFVADNHLFTHSNYHFDDSLFYKLKAMADSYSIEAHNAPIVDDLFFSQLEQKLVEKKLSIAYIDLSNAWQRAYTTPTHLASINNNLRNALTKKSRFVLTRDLFISRVTQHKLRWEYYYLSSSQMKFLMKSSLHRFLTEAYLFQTLPPNLLFPASDQCISKLVR